MMGMGPRGPLTWNPSVSQRVLMHTGRNILRYQKPWCIITAKLVMDKWREWKMYEKGDFPKAGACTCAGQKLTLNFLRLLDIHTFWTESNSMSISNGCELYSFITFDQIIRFSSISFVWKVLLGVFKIWKIRIFQFESLKHWASGKRCCSHDVLHSTQGFW